MTRDICHIVHGMGIGGIETWLMHIFRAQPQLRDRTGLIITGSISSTRPSYEHEVQAMGIPIYRVPFSYAAFPYMRRLAKLLRQLQPQITHCHHSYLSGLSTYAARLAGVPLRIAHYHSPYPSYQRTPQHLLYAHFAHVLERKSATAILGCSSDTLTSHFGADWHSNPRISCLYCGINLDPFSQPMHDRMQIRAELGLPADAFVIGHIGRFTIQKNHTFLLQILQALQVVTPNAHLVLVGDGPLREEIAQQAAAMRLADRVHFIGTRTDVPDLMRSAFDIFVLPSLLEGLGLVAVEAQAAGLPCIIADTVPEEVTVIPAMVTRIPLQASAEAWAQAIFTARPAAIDPTHCLHAVAASPFSIGTSIRSLEQIYRGNDTDAQTA